MTMDELLQKLRIDKKPIENDNGSYTIDLDSSNEYARYYSKLDHADFLEEDDEASQVTADTSSIQYVNDDFAITLLADLINNTYKMIIRENYKNSDI